MSNSKVGIAAAVTIFALITAGGCPSTPIQGIPQDPIAAQMTLDRDLDGFADEMDPAPDDASIPAALGSPEAILAHPLVAAAISETRSRGLVFAPETILDASFDMASSYSTDGDGTAFTITSDGTDEGRQVAPLYETLTRSAAGLYRVSGVQPETDSGRVEVLGVASLRGSREHYTIYSVGRNSCDEGGAKYIAEIEIGTVEPKSGDRVALVALSVVVKVESTPPCDAPGGDEAGGWQVYTINRLERE